jgi:hypothetical protein
MLVFVHINKTAGTTMRYMLRSTYGSRHCDVEPWKGTQNETPFSSEDLRRLRTIYPRLSSIAGHRVMGYVDLVEDGTDFEYLTFLRDPLRMCASRFQYQIDHGKKKGLVFEEWVQRDWLRNAQTRRIAGTASVDDAIRVIKSKEMFVGLTERFDESIVLLKGMRVPDLDISYVPVNVARRNTLADELLSRQVTREAIADANRVDLELYAYVTEELVPQQRREYGPGLDEAVAAHLRVSRRNWNRRNVVASRMKQHGLYRPLLKLYRRQLVGRPVRSILV